MAEDLVIISIGHSTMELSRGYSPVKDISVRDAIKGDPGFRNNGISEYLYCNSLAPMIISELQSIGVKGRLSNRKECPDAELSFHTTSPSNMKSSALAAKIREFKSSGINVAAVIELHLNGAAGGSRKPYGLEFLYSGRNNKTASHELGACIRANLAKIQGYVNNRGSGGLKEWTGNGAGWCNTICQLAPCGILELFFADSLYDLKWGVEHKGEIAKAIAIGIKQFIDKDFPAYDPATMPVSSSTLAAGKVEQRFDEEQVRNVAQEAQQTLTPHERRMGEGGDRYDVSLRNSVEVIGTASPQISSTRTDATGNVYSQPVLRMGGTVGYQRTYPMYEAIDISGDMPTGKKYIVAHSLYQITAYEANLFSQTHIRVKAGSIAQLQAKDQVDITADSNVIIGAGTICTISSPAVNMTGRISVSGNLGCDGPMMTNNIFYADSGIYATSFNGPAVIDATNTQELYGYLVGNPTTNTKIPDMSIPISGEITVTDGTLGGSANSLGSNVSGSLKINGTLTITNGEGKIQLISVEDGSGGVGAGSNGLGSALVQIPPHKHYFKRLNGVLANNFTGVQRNIASQFNSGL